MRTICLALLLASVAAAGDLPKLTVEATSSFTNDGIEFVFEGDADYPDGTVIACKVDFMGETAAASWARGRVTKGHYKAISPPIPATKRVFAGGSNLLGPDEVLDWHDFLKKISDDGRSGASTPAKRIWAMLDDAARKELADALKTPTVDPAHLTSLLPAINKVLQGRDFFNTSDFAVGLGDEATRLTAKKPEELTPWQVERRNRLLIEALWDETSLTRAMEAPYEAVAIFDWMKQEQDVFPRIVGDPRLKDKTSIPPAKLAFQVGTREQETSESAEMAEKIRSFLDPIGGVAGKTGFVEEIEEKYAGAVSKKEFCGAGGEWSQEAFQRWLDDFAPRVKNRFLELQGWIDGCLVPKYPAHFKTLTQTYYNVDMLWRLRVEALFKAHHVPCPDAYLPGPPIAPRPPVDRVKAQILADVERLGSSPPLAKPRPPKKPEAGGDGGNK